MEWKRGALCAFLLVAALEAQAAWIGPFISELHYDNEGTDVGEFVAVTAPSGTSFEGWSLELYNGETGLSYRTVHLAGSVVGGSPGWGEAYWDIGRLQNGPDGVALVGPGAKVVDLIVYGGLFDLVDGPAAGATALELPVTEDRNTPVGWSLQRIGGATEWAWRAGPESRGALNTGLRLASAAQVPAAGPMALLPAGGLALALSLALVRRRPFLPVATG